jgi:DNA polymerase III subunit beta
MKFDCDVKTLDKALGAVVRVVPNRTSMTILGHVLLDATAEGLTLTATDLEVGVRIRVAAEVGETGATTVPAKLLAGVIGELNEERATVVLKDNRLRISAGRANTTLATMEAHEFPPGPQPADGEAIMVPREELLKAIGQVRPAVSSDEARAVLTGVLLRLNGEHLTLVATDGHRLVETRVDGVKSAAETAILPVKALTELGRAFKDETGAVELRFAPARNQAFFRCGAAEVTSRLVDGQYPSYDQVIPKQAATVVRAPRAELVRAVRMVGVVSESIGSRPVSLLIDASGIRVTSQALDIGEAEAEVEAQLEGEATHIALSSRFLLDALSAFDTERVELRLSGALAPAVIRGVDVDSCTCVVMPIRLAVPPAAKARSEAA